MFIIVNQLTIYDVMNQQKLYFAVNLCIKCDIKQFTRRMYHEK